MKNLLLVFGLLISQIAVAQLSVCRLFSDHAVLQRQKPLPIWGKTKANDKITVQFAHKMRTTVADTEGVWRVTFEPFEAPVFESALFDATKAVISFKYVGKGLLVKDRYGYLKGFEVAGDDRVFYYARAEIQGDKIVVYHPKGVKPVSVRYAWSDAPEEANLFNADGFPANSFRTDNWKGNTEGVRFD